MKTVDLDEGPEAFWRKLTDEEVESYLRAAPKVAIWKRTKNGTLHLDSTYVRVVTQNQGIVAEDTKGFAGFVTLEDIPKREKALRDDGFRIPNTPDTAERG